VIQLLVWLTTLVHVGGLAVSLCLGLYLVMRPPRSWPSWLAALTLWSVLYLSDQPYHVRRAVSRSDVPGFPSVDPVAAPFGARLFLHSIGLRATTSVGEGQLVTVDGNTGIA